jgi:hypothetical protein
MKLKQYLNEVYMSKALGRDLDASRNKKKKNKFAIKVDGFSEEETKTIKSANTKRAEWIRFTMRNRKISKAEAEKIVVIEEL